MTNWAYSGVIVANEHAGGATPSPADRVAAVCGTLLDEVSVVRTAHAGHARVLAAKASRDGRDVVVAVGGDGTASEVAAGLHEAATGAGRGPCFLPLPAGTGNSFYREVWQDAPWQEALARSLGTAEPRVRRLDLARLEPTGATVLLGACSGLVAEALVTAAALTGIAGRARYEEAVAATLRRFAPHPARITVDGEVVHEGGVVLANVGGGRYRGGGFLLLPRSVLDDGLLDVCVVSDRLEARELPGLTRDGRHLERPGVLYRRGRRVEIERTDGEDLVFERDGEVQRPARRRYAVEVLPGVLPTLAPPPDRTNRTRGQA
ncbi:diacylglycerol/lipid kinase family protein [Streptomyces sp. NPDC048172]|uniref:diacylglycerol/lipid kinase family protein n=1 Tax=Streptomyces sp. NPDC048172 TaxID=3365505 RepID=UPI00371F6C42